MKIGLDYDGTIADSNIMKSHWIKDNLNIDIPSWKTDRTSCICELANHISINDAEKVYNNFSEFIYSGEYAKAAPEIPGAIEGIQTLAKTHDLFIVTARFQSHMEDMIKWLDAHNVLHLFKDYFSMRIEDKKMKCLLSKQEICSFYDISVLVDDDERHLKKINLPNLKRILIKNGSSDNTDNLKGIIYANSWKQILNEIGNIQ